jgi:hypothetical protein
LRDARLDVGLVIKLLDNALKHQIEIDVRMNGDIDLGLIMTGEPRQAVERLPDRIQAGERDLERALRFRLTCDPVDPLLELRIGLPSSSRVGRQATAAVPRAVSFMMAFDEASLRQFARFRCRLEALMP